MKEREINKAIRTYRISSEPGDGTRYDYLIEKGYFDPELYRVYGRESTFTFPKYLRLAQAERVVAEVNFPERTLSDFALRLSAEDKCNPWTLYEVASAIVQISKEVS